MGFTGGSPHENALAAIMANMLPGSVLEVVHKDPWGFGELAPKCVNVCNFLSSVFPVMEECYSNVILHLLQEEGNLSEGIMRGCISTAAEIATRVLVLCRNPELIAGMFYDLKYDSLCVEIDGRNTLVISTVFPGFNHSLNCLNASNIDKALCFNFPDRPEYDVSIFRLSSERQPESGRLLRYEDASELSRCPTGIIVSGGLMFLNIMAEVPNRRYDIIDLSLKQLLFDMLVVQSIIECDKKEDFLQMRRLPDVSRKLIAMSSGVASELFGYFSTMPVERNQWKDVVHSGIWLARYNAVRQMCISGSVRFSHCGLKDVERMFPFSKDSSFVYTSTVDPSEWKHLTGRYCIVEAFTKRDIPRIF